MANKTKDNNSAGGFQSRLAKVQTPAEWLQVMLEWMQAREAADERRWQAWQKRQQAEWQAWHESQQAEWQAWHESQQAEWQAWQKRQQAEWQARDNRQQAEWQAWQKQNKAREAADEKRWQAWEEKSRKQEEKLDRIGDRLGGWGNSEGDIFEMECAEAIRNSEGLAGVHFDHIHTRLCKTRLRVLYEYDIVGVNKKETMAIEVKRTLRPDDVIRFADERLPHFAKLFPDYAKGRKISGAVIFRRAPLDDMPDGTTADPVAIAMQKGIIPVQATGKNKLQPIDNLDKVRR